MNHRGPKGYPHVGRTIDQEDFGEPEKPRKLNPLSIQCPFTHYVVLSYFHVLGKQKKITKRKMNEINGPVYKSENTQLVTEVNI